MKYVYIIQSLENGFYKIGISKHPSKRIEELQTGNSSILKLIDVYKSEFANKIEKALHRRYSHLYINGEWFEGEVLIESEFNKLCKKVEDNIIFLKKKHNTFI